MGQRSPHPSHPLPSGHRWGRGGHTQVLDIVGLGSGLRVGEAELPQSRPELGLHPLDVLRGSGLVVWQFPRSHCCRVLLRFGLVVPRRWVEKIVADLLCWQQLLEVCSEGFDIRSSGGSDPPPGRPPPPERGVTLSLYFLVVFTGMIFWNHRLKPCFFFLQQLHPGSFHKFLMRKTQ